MKAPLSTLLLLLGSAPTAFAQALVFDDFNRPDSTDLGPDWSEVNGDFVLLSGRCKGNVPFANDTWMHHTGFAQPYTASKARIEFARDAGDGFFGSGLVVGLDPSSWSGVAVMLQDNDLDGLFDRLFFHAAINAGAWFSQPTPVFHDLPTQLVSGQLTVWVQDGGDVALARIEDSAGNLIGTYSAAGIVGTPFAPTGTAAGVWARSRPFFDDFYALERRALDAYPAALSVSGGGEQTLDLTFESAHAGELYFVVSSQTAASPGTPIGGGVLLPLVIDPITLWVLGHPNTAPYEDNFGTLDTFGHARARLRLLAGSSPSFVGLTLHHAGVALDPVSFAPTAATNSAPVDLLP
ncbi:MAG: hypothetical protein AAF682_18525 [Planctomycetota bacterium]